MSKQPKTKIKLQSLPDSMGVRKLVFNGEVVTDVTYPRFCLHKGRVYMYHGVTPDRSELYVAVNAVEVV